MPREGFLIPNFMNLNQDFDKRQPSLLQKRQKIELGLNLQADQKINVPVA